MSPRRDGRDGSPGELEHALRKATLQLGEQRLVTAYGEFDVHFFRDLASDTTAMAVSCGSLSEERPLLVRVHSSCVTSECLMGRDCDCSEQLEGALAAIAAEGRGVVFYLMQEGRGAGLTAKARDRMMVQASGNRITTFEAYASMGLPADLRSYDVVAPMSRLLGICAPIKLLTNNPEKAEAVATALAAEKIEVLGTETVQGLTSTFNRDYLTAKHDSGHQLDRLGLSLEGARTAGALPPSSVRVFEPMALAEDAEKVVTASYFLPIELPRSASEGRAVELDEVSDRSAIPGAGIHWFRLSVLYDRRAEKESILISLQDEAESAVAIREILLAAESASPPNHPPIRMRLFDRLPGPDSEGRAELRQALADLRLRGEGAVKVYFDDRDHAGV